MREAVIVIDMVNDFVTGKLKCDRAKPTIPRIRFLLEAARKKGKPVIYASDAHLPVDNELKVWGPHAMKGTEGARIIDELSPSKQDFVLEKRTYSAFHETGLDNILKALRVDNVIITGLHTNICDRHTAADAFFRGYRVIVPEDCVEAFSEEQQTVGLEYLKMAYGAKITRSEEIVKKW